MSKNTPLTDEWKTLDRIRWYAGNILHRTDYDHGKHVGSDDADCEAARAITDLTRAEGPLSERVEQIREIAQRLYSRHNPIAATAKAILDKCKVLT